jgi:hypothetical protein
VCENVALMCYRIHSQNQHRTGARAPPIASAEYGAFAAVAQCRRAQLGAGMLRVQIPSAALGILKNNSTILGLTGAQDKIENVFIQEML